MVNEKTIRYVRKSEYGFTLVEVMLALGILAFGIMAVTTMQGSALLGTSTANALSLGITMAVDRIEKLKSLPFDKTHADLINGNHVDPSPPNGYEIAWNVTHDAPIPKTTMTITVTVTWRGGQKTTQLEYIKTQY